MSDCFTRGIACNTRHECSRRGCRRKALGMDPVDHARGLRVERPRPPVTEADILAAIDRARAQWTGPPTEGADRIVAREILRALATRGVVVEIDARQGTER